MDISIPIFHDGLIENLCSRMNDHVNPKLGGE